MIKSILISIRPEHVVKILNGEKTLELRKNIPADFEEIVKKYGGIFVNIYVTNALPFLIDYHGEYILSSKHLWGLKELNGKVVARFWFDEHICTCGWRLKGNTGFLAKRNEREEKLPQAACLTIEEMIDYVGGHDTNVIYGWYIKKLEIFDVPKELKDFHYYKTKTVYSGMDCPPYVDEVKTTLTKAPQSWRYIEEGK